MVIYDQDREGNRIRIEQRVDGEADLHFSILDSKDQSQIERNT